MVNGYVKFIFTINLNRYFHLDFGWLFCCMKNWPIKVYFNYFSTVENTLTLKKNSMKTKRNNVSVPSLKDSIFFLYIRLAIDCSSPKALSESLSITGVVVRLRLCNVYGQPKLVWWLVNFAPLKWPTPRHPRVPHTLSSGSFAEKQFDKLP